MKVLKFGGTSVGKPERMHQVARLITAEKGRKIVVLSALSGTTNTLVNIGEAVKNGELEACSKLCEDLHDHYNKYILELLQDESHRKVAESIIDEHFSFFKSIQNKLYTDAVNKELLAQGELLSTKLFSTYLQEKNIKSKLLSALDFMYIDEDKEPDLDYIEGELASLLEENRDIDLFVTQGFICVNHLGTIDNLKRGGSDYSASLIGAAIRAQEVQIWTDIDGMHNNDPRIVDKTSPIAELSFDEAAELAYFGAKILHPSSIWPAQKFNIPVWLKNTMEPQAHGTIIKGESKMSGIKAIAAKDNITAIKIKSSRMLLAYGFLRRVFEIFEKYKTPIDMITTSEVAVSLTIDDDKSLENIVNELKEFGIVTVDLDQTIICIVGDFVVENRSIVKNVFDSLTNIPLRMISYGGSRHNISLLINSNLKKETLQSLNDGLF
ncbi:MAG: aspartate kinase [Bacteroidota bacterium]|nr:aspartate kinase [Bacteroidota bacterium]